jgi:hypothetical protein
VQVYSYFAASKKINYRNLTISSPQNIYQK